MAILYETLAFLISLAIYHVDSLQNNNYYILKNHPLKENFELNRKEIDLKKIKEVPRKSQLPQTDIQRLLKTIKSKDVGKFQDAHSYCRSFSTCFECVKSMWHPCDWCHDYGCTHIGASLCASSQDTDRVDRNLSSCPFIQRKTPILIPSGIKTHIEVPINMPDSAVTDDGIIICQIKVANNAIHLKGIVSMNTVYCFPVNIETNNGVDYGVFSVIWGGAEPYSNEIPLIVYQCNALADTCEDCRKLPSEYRCGWCEGTQSCAMASVCNDIIRWSLNRLSCQFNKKQMYFV